MEEAGLVAAAARIDGPISRRDEVGCLARDAVERVGVTCAKGSPALTKGRQFLPGKSFR
jgi:hypothetical protein